MTEPHRIFPHGELKALADGLWQVQGSLALPLPRNMTVWRMNDGKLLIISAVAMDEDGMAALERLGEPGAMIVPHPFHIMDAAFFKQRYPDLFVVAGAHASKRLTRQFGGACPVDATPEEGCARLGVGVRVVPGMKLEELTLELAADGGRALVFTDVFTATPVKKLTDRLAAAPRGGVGLARVVRMRQVNDRRAIAAYFRELAELPNLRWLLTAHGRAISDDCAAVLRHAADHA